mmetsp:Transcript_40557/g.115585  ORF Transcript_40557/g.115585 Transcript_40557/m.115585 type:complete len:219 (-) Transcript_40557:2079-2735(-)
MGDGKHPAHAPTARDGINSRQAPQQQPLPAAKPPHCPPGLASRPRGAARKLSHRCVGADTLDRHVSLVLPDAGALLPRLELGDGEARGAGIAFVSSLVIALHGSAGCLCRDAGGHACNGVQERQVPGRGVATWAAGWRLVYGRDAHPSPVLHLVAYGLLSPATRRHTDGSPAAAVPHLDARVPARAYPAIRVALCSPIRPTWGRRQAARLDLESAIRS